MEENQVLEPVPEMDGYKKIPTFKLWVANQFPYIETDFDAITNYELLQAVVKYLNTVIENENNVESNVTALYNAFVNLHDYVEEQFDELNLQDEVNNKIDEMYESGLFDNLLNNYLNLTKVFDTYNDMMADTSAYVVGMKLKTLGYHYINDGGGAEYVVTSTQSETHYQVTIGLNKYIELITKDDIVNIKQLGAYGDGTQDDTNAINVAISKFNDIFAPEGAYKITDTLVFDTNKHIEFNGNIVYAGTRDKPAILIKGRYNRIKLNDIVDTNSYNNVNYREGWHGWSDNNYSAIELQDFSYSTLKFNIIANFTAGVKINGITAKGTFKADISGYTIADCKYGIYVKNINPSWINNCKINDIMINYLTSSGEFYNNANPITTYGVYQENVDGDTYGMRFMEFNNLFFETTRKDNFIGFYFNLIGKSQFNMCIPEIKNGTTYALFDMKYIVENVVSPENHSYENIFYDCRQMYGSHNDIVFANTGKIVCSLPQIAKHNNIKYNEIFKDTNLVGKAGMVTNNKSNVRGYGVTFLTSTTLTLNDYQLIKTNATRAITNDFDNRYLDIPSSYPLALMLKVSLNETYKIKVGPNGNVGIKLFNSNGELIDGIVDNVKKLGGYFGYNSNYKYMKSLSGPLNDFEFTVIDENVAYVLLMIYDQVNSIEISKFNAIGDVIKLAPYLAHISQLGDVNCSDVKPTTDTTNGAYIGQTFYKSALANLGEKWVFDGTSWN